VTSMRFERRGKSKSTICQSCGGSEPSAVEKSPLTFGEAPRRRRRLLTNLGRRKTGAVDCPCPGLDWQDGHVGQKFNASSKVVTLSG